MFTAPNSTKQPKLPPTTCRGFFVAFYFLFQIPNKSGVVAFRQGLETLALGWVRRGFASAPLFCCLITQVSIFSMHLNA